MENAILRQLFSHSLSPPNGLLFNSLNSILNYSKDHSRNFFARPSEDFSLLKAFLGSLTSALTIKKKKNGEPGLHLARIMNYLQFYRILPWTKHSFNLDHFLLSNIQIVLGPPQSWSFTWQISNPWETSSDYFSNTMLELARNECPHVNHGARVKGLNLVEWEPKCFQFYQDCHSPNLSLC